VSYLQERVSVVCEIGKIEVSKFFIRSNANELILLKLSGDRDIKMILCECSMGLSKEQLYSKRPLT
jgi:hypothetical protein